MSGILDLGAKQSLWKVTPEQTCEGVIIPAGITYAPVISLVSVFPTGLLHHENKAFACLVHEGLSVLRTVPRTSYVLNKQCLACSR